eukprot:gene8733-681_t
MSLLTKSTSKSNQKYHYIGPSVEIKSISGTNLVAKDINGFSDPYVIFKTGNFTYKSKIQKKTLNPNWADEFSLFVSSKYLTYVGILQIECWDHDILKSDDFLGKCFFSLQKLKNNETQIVKLNLAGVKNGTIEFEITAKDFDIKTDIIYEDVMGLENPYHSVLEKLKDSTYQNSMSDRMILSVAESLSNIEELKKKYLSISWAETIKLQKELQTHSSSNILSEEEKLNACVDETDDEILLNEQIDDSSNDLKELEIKEKLNEEIWLKENVKIKIIFIDQLKDDKVLVEMRKFFSPIISNVSGSKMGLFHSALMIGPWLLEWNNSALCIPRKCVSTAAFLSADIAEIQTVENLESVRDKLASIIILWNTSMEYDKLNNKKGRGNCQLFVESVLEAIDVKINFTGPLAKYLKNMREKGASKLSFQADKEFQKKFQLKLDTVVFENHADLDIFTANLIEIDSDFEKNHKDEFLLLKSFDRAFWMKYYKKLEQVDKITKQIDALKNGKFTPLRQKQVDAKIEMLKEKMKNLKIEGEKDIAWEVNNCPFSDPSKTKSFRF